MEPVTSARGSLGKDFWEDYKEATIGLTYSTTSDISRVKHTLGALVVCIIQVEGFQSTKCCSFRELDSRVWLGCSSLKYRIEREQQHHRLLPYPNCGDWL